MLPGVYDNSREVYHSNVNGLRLVQSLSIMAISAKHTFGQKFAKWGTYPDLPEDHEHFIESEVSMNKSKQVLESLSEMNNVGRISKGTHIVVLNPPSDPEKDTLTSALTPSFKLVGDHTYQAQVDVELEHLQKIAHENGSKISVL